MELALHSGLTLAAFATILWLAGIALMIVAVKRGEFSKW